MAETHAEHAGEPQASDAGPQGIETPAGSEAGTGEPTEAPGEYITVREAAARMGLSERGVRKRLEAGTLAGERTPAGWRIPAAAAVPDAGTASRREAGGTSSARRAGTGTAAAPGPGMAPAPVDLAPLAAIIERQAAEVQRLTEAATVWQLRAIRAEERLQAIEANASSAAETAADTPGGPRASASGADGPDTGRADHGAQAGVWAALRRWLRGEPGER